jgi:hypothetical protein
MMVCDLSLRERCFWWGEEEPRSNPVKSQSQFKNRRKNRSRRGDEAELFFAPKSAFFRPRLPFLNTPWAGTDPRYSLWALGLSGENNHGVKIMSALSYEYHRLQGTTLKR